MTLSADQLFEIWAPSESRWSAWAKPILFAYAPSLPSAMEPVYLPQIEGFPSTRDTAVIVDLPGATSVYAGLALAKVGYRPVPLYNSGISSGMLIYMTGIAELLTASVDILKRCPLEAGSPPAFLLNADRMDHSAQATTPGRYDNRWCVVPQDMPSAGTLLDAEIKQVVLVAEEVKDDITHVLCRYQEAGLRLFRAPSTHEPLTALTVTPPRFYKSIWYRLGVFSGLRRNAAGGFGAVVPNPNSGGGYGGIGGFG
jgi:hypothetical protein